jgi:hypothetical protein
LLLLVPREEAKLLMKAEDSIKGSTRRSEASDESGRFNKRFHVERFIERTSE